MMSHKKIHRFLVEHIPLTAVGMTVTVHDSRIAKQINRVLKIRPGEDVQLFIDSGPDHTLTITETTDSSITGTLVAITPVDVPARHIIAAISIVKGDTFELMVQKLTEIGVHTIVPLISNRTVKQAVRLNRLQAISDEAVEQCGGTQRVTITDPLTVTECFEQYPFDSVVLDPLTTNTSLETLSAAMVCYVGPEGGWDEHDETVMEFFKPQHLKITDRVLRTETAAILGIYKLLWS
jgi:16S rRNA (uracil1498-N3)-methyltransferase